MGRKKSVSCDDPDTRKAIELYRDGVPLERAAAAIFLSSGGLRHRFKALGIPTRETRRGKKLSPEFVEKIRRELRSGKTYTQLAQEYGLSITTVYKYAK